MPPHVGLLARLHLLDRHEPVRLADAVRSEGLPDRGGQRRDVVVARHRAGATAVLQLALAERARLERSVQREDGLLYRSSEGEAADEHLLLLPEAVDAPSRLRLERRVHRRLHEDDLGRGRQCDAHGRRVVCGDAYGGAAAIAAALELADEPVARADGRVLVEREDGEGGRLAQQHLHERLLHDVELCEDDHARQRVGAEQRRELSQQRGRLGELGALAALLHRAHTVHAVVGELPRALGRAGGGARARGAREHRSHAALILVGCRRTVEGASARAQPALHAFAEVGTLLVDPRPWVLRVQPVGQAVGARGEVVERALVRRELEHRRLHAGVGQRERRRTMDALRLRVADHQPPNVGHCLVGQRAAAEAQPANLVAQEPQLVTQR